jgi:DNA-directed RNA polymerase specialized sigma24 family protein
LPWRSLGRGPNRIMSQTGTITRCIRDLEGGESPRRNAAARELWEFFFADLMCYARRRLQAANASRGSADEEDAAERAFTKVCRGIESGHLKLTNRIDLRKVLRSASTHEVITLLHRNKRDAGRTSDESLLHQVPDAALPPELLLLAFDACQRLLDLLENDELRQIAIWKLAGHTNEAIRVQLGCSLATVERILAHIRETWRRKWNFALPDSPAKAGRRHTSLADDDSLKAGSMSQITPADATRILRGLAGLP